MKQEYTNRNWFEESYNEWYQVTSGACHGTDEFWKREDWEEEERDRFYANAKIYDFQHALSACLVNPDIKMIRIEGKMEFTVSVHGQLYVRWDEEGEWELFTYFPNAHGEWYLRSKYDN